MKISIGAALKNQRRSATVKNDQYYERFQYLNIFLNEISEFKLKETLFVILLNGLALKK